jgi:hypothetical protein
MSDRDNATTLMRIALCPECGRHAHFLYEGERISGEFLSQEQGKSCINKFRLNPGIPQREVNQLMCQLQELGLPMEIPDDMQDLLDLDGRLLMMESALPGFDHGDVIDSLHEFLATFFPEAPMTLQ